MCLQRRKPAHKHLRQYLKDYDYSQNNAYFIMICKQNRIHLFGEILCDAVAAHLCVRPNNPDGMIEKLLFESCCIISVFITYIKKDQRSDTVSLVFLLFF